MTDAELTAVFEQHRNAVYRFAWRMTGSVETADDVTQDVFLALLLTSSAWGQTLVDYLAIQEPARRLGRIRYLDAPRVRGGHGPRT